jgi:predicted ester cyclase
MSTEENKAIVRRFIHNGVIGGDLDLIDQLCSPDCVNHSAIPEARIGTAGMKRVVAASRAAQPDQRWTTEMVIAEGELVMIRGIREATSQADGLRGILTPQGKRVVVELVHIFRIRDGTIIEHWAVRDDLGLMKQLGVISPRSTATPARSALQRRRRSAGHAVTPHAAGEASTSRRSVSMGTGLTKCASKPASRVRERSFSWP